MSAPAEISCASPSAEPRGGHETSTQIPVITRNRAGAGRCMLSLIEAAPLTRRTASMSNAEHTPSLASPVPAPAHSRRGAGGTDDIAETRTTVPFNPQRPYRSHRRRLPRNGAGRRHQPPRRPGVDACCRHHDPGLAIAARLRPFGARGTNGTAVRRPLRGWAPGQAVTCMRDFGLACRPIRPLARGGAGQTVAVKPEGAGSFHGRTGGCHANPAS